MIPSIITLLLRRYSKRHPEQFMIIKRKLLHASKIFFLICLALCFFLVAKAQEQNLIYTIKRNGNVIGNMNVKEVRSGGKTSLSLQSNIKTTFLLTFTAKGKEEAIYENGKMIYSLVHQIQNGSEKINKKIFYVNNGYVVDNKGDKEKFESSNIKFNLICLYTQEPLTISHLYSDKLQKFLPIRKIAEHHYRVIFSDNNYNDYFYRNGICNKVVVNNFIYSVVMELKF